MKVLAVGDIHRKVELLQHIIRFYKQGDYDRIVFVGDYADDFQGSWANTDFIWSLLTALTKQPDVIALIGNHDFAYGFAEELMLLYGTNNVQTGFDPATLANIGLEKRKWVQNLPVIVEIDGVYYSHAGITQQWYEKWMRDKDYKELNTLEQARILFGDQTSPIWARPAPDYQADIKQVFGHTPMRTCQEAVPSAKGLWCIDTHSTNHLGTPIGDGSLLEIVDGKQFRVIPKNEWLVV